MLSIPIALFVGGSFYLLSYYGWVRTFHAPEEYAPNGMFELDYERVPGRSFSRALERLHAPLRWLDERRYTRLYDTSNRDMPMPDFGQPPDLAIQCRTSAATQRAAPTTSKSEGE